MGSVGGDCCLDHVEVKDMANGDACIVDEKELLDPYRKRAEVSYGVDEIPPWYMCLLLGFQHYLSMFVATLSIPMVLAPAICLGEDNVGKSQIIGTLFVASGIITLLQSFVGVRLPIVQAGTFAILSPTLAYLRLPQWKCPANIGPPGPNETVGPNYTYIEVGSPEHREIWMSRLREIQGAIMVAAMFELVMGLSGIVGILLKYIGPLSICPTISLLGLSLFRSAAGLAAKQWWIAILTIFLIVLFSQYLGWLNVPCFVYKMRKGCSQVGYPVFKLFPVVLGMLITWLVCYILTVTNVFPSNKNEWGYGARTDIRNDVLDKSAWFRFPYPGQWGTPTVSVSAVFGILAGVLATTVESVGDYHACARLAGAPPPPTHAINRGIMIEGFGTFLDGLFGTGNGTTSTSINVGVVGLTKVGSRVVVQVAAVFMIVLGVFNKFGALFVTVPDPVIGGSFFILFGMIVAVGISNLQHVDLNSGRNLFVFGFAFFFGLTVPQWLVNNPTAIQTGNQTVDSIVYVLLSTSMFVGGVIGFVLDNTIPGTAEERGLAKARGDMTGMDPVIVKLVEKRTATVYDLPFGMGWLRKQKYAKYIPICPVFQQKTSNRADGESELVGKQEDVVSDENLVTKC